MTYFIIYLRLYYIIISKKRRYISIAIEYNFRSNVKAFNFLVD